MGLAYLGPEKLSQGKVYTDSPCDCLPVKRIGDVETLSPFYVPFTQYYDVMTLKMC